MRKTTEGKTKRHKLENREMKVELRDDVKSDSLIFDFFQFILIYSQRSKTREKENLLKTLLTNLW